MGLAVVEISSCHTPVYISANHRHQSIYSIVGVHGNGETRRASGRSLRTEGPNSEASRAERDGVLGQRLFPFPPARRFGGAL